MTDNDDRDMTADMQAEFRAGRKFSIADLIAQEGGDFLKGDSPVPKLTQAMTEINLYISNHLSDSSGALQAILQTRVKGDEVTVSRHLNEPLLALRDILESLLDHPYRLYDLVKQADVKWGQMYDERPHFQKPGQLPHPDDEYSHESVRQKLTDLLATLPPNHD